MPLRSVNVDYASKQANQKKPVVSSPMQDDSVARAKKGRTLYDQDCLMRPRRTLLKGRDSDTPFVARHFLPSGFVIVDTPISVIHYLLG